MASESNADYFLDNYGVCKLPVCKCLQEKWLGRGCLHWHPAGVTSYEQLAAGQKLARRVLEGS